MNYIYTLVLRLIGSILIVIYGPQIIFKLLYLPTFYLSYFLLIPYGDMVFGNFIYVADKKLEFVSACIATSAYILLSLLILLTKDIDFYKIIKIFLMGSFILFSVNIIRIYMLAVVLIKFDIILFNSLHLFFWQVFSTLFVLLLWIFLINFYNINTIPVYSDLKYLFKKL